MQRFELQTELECSAEAAWEAVQRRALLEHVTHPLLKFMPVGLEELPARFQAGGTHPLKLYLLGFIPLGEHTIHMTRVDPERREIHTEESGRLVKTWNHRITIRPDGRGGALYEDGLELDAGRLTPIVAGAARLFYRHRQARWRALARTL